MGTQNHPATTPRAPRRFLAACSAKLPCASNRHTMAIRRNKFSFRFAASLAGLPLVLSAEEASTQSIAGGDLADLNIEQLMEVKVDSVFTASRREQKTWEAPAPLSIVTRDEIKSFGYRSLANELTAVP